MSILCSTNNTERNESKSCGAGVKHGEWHNERGAIFNFRCTTRKKKPARNAIFNTISQRKRRIGRERGVGKQMGVQPERLTDRWWVDE